MRKIFIAALAALVLVIGAAGALAQSSSGGSLKVTLKPNKAGTKTHPRGTALRMIFTNDNHSLTATKITLLLAKNVKVSYKGFKFCSISKIKSSTGAACPSKSKIGKGTANAVAGVNTTTPTELAFNMTAFLASKKSLGFLLQQQGGGISAVAVGKLSSASGKYATKLTVIVPDTAKEFPPGVFNGLVKLDTTLGAKAGKNNFVGLTGCPSNRKLPFSATINFQPNPNPPPRPSVTATTTAKCTK